MISVCILTKNSASTLEKALQSALRFDEIIVLDSGSEDETIEIAQKYPKVRIHTSPFLGFGPLRDLAALFAKNDWILALDSDEELSEELVDEIQGLFLDEEKVYAMRRKNFFRGKQMRCCGWGGDVVIRLYHKNHARFGSKLLHESIEKKRKVLLKGCLYHTPYRSTSDFLAKMQHYSTLFAEENQGKKRSSFPKAFFHGTFSFLKSYFVKKGIFYGVEGFLLSLYNANTAFYKYLKLSEANLHREGKEALFLRSKERSSERLLRK